MYCCDEVSRVPSHAFNPVTLNLLVIVIAVVGWIASSNLPSAMGCLRKVPLKVSDKRQEPDDVGALGSDFQKLHPRIQERFSLTSESSFALRGTGVMETLWHGADYTLAFLYIGTWRSIMFPESGHHVPFTIQNYAYVDTFGHKRFRCR